MPDTPPIVQLKIPPDTSLPAQLKAIGLGLLSKRLATISLAGCVTTFARLSDHQLAAITGMACVAMICWTWEKVATAPK